MGIRGPRFQRWVEVAAVSILPVLAVAEFKSVRGVIKQTGSVCPYSHWYVACSSVGLAVEPNYEARPGSRCAPLWSQGSGM